MQDQQGLCRHCFVRVRRHRDWGELRSGGWSDWTHVGGGRACAPSSLADPFPETVSYASGEGP